ncbi:MSC_0619 family F1-like ATPase alpha subunit [Mycoplasmopsis adleri]|uniref:MSC_0619 family F1-like ATPase alpha subunit n=1 Tax=Mycoplasmopsis adleri TaxID=51362 RepID=UPI003872EA59
MVKNNTQPYINAIFDYVVELKGQYKYRLNQVFELEESKENIKLLLISATEDKAYCLTNARPGMLKVGMHVKESNNIEAVRTNKALFGKVIDIANNVLYSEGANKADSYYAHENQPFNKPNELLEYEPLTEQLSTGYISVDLLIPIGKGQRELIIGDRKTGKTHIALNTIINQKHKNVKCIYVAIGQPQSQVADVYNTLKKHEALDYTMIIDASSNSPFDQYLAPYIGMAHAENISRENDALIIFDNLTNHANIYREIALLINKPVGKEAFPGDMFYAHSRLLERSGKFKNRNTITALPILQTIENDITSAIASNIISITDGQIVTNCELFALGKLPAIDIDLSVSRIGGNVQKSYISKVAGEIGKIYRSYKRQIKLALLKYDLNDETSNLINNGALVESMFIQKGISVYSEHTMFLTSKLISWEILKGIDDIPLAIKFVNEMLKIDDLSKELFQNLLVNKVADESLVKNYFAFNLMEYSRIYNLGWSIELDGEFFAKDKSFYEQINNKIIGVK